MVISKISGREVSEAAFLTELMCMRQAFKKKVKLSDGFWRDRLWKKEYSLQIISANALLKIFDFTDIYKALTSKDGDWIHSLRFRGLSDIIKSYADKRAMQEKVAKSNTKPTVREETVQEKSGMAENAPKKSIRDLLD